jgi:hypothetical protein
MSIFFPHHAADHEAMVHAHGRFTDDVGDLAIRLQDKAYELGRARGKLEAFPARLTDEQILEVAEPFGEFMFGDAQGHKRIAFARALIDKFTGSAA